MGVFVEDDIYEGEKKKTEPVKHLKNGIEHLLQCPEDGNSTNTGDLEASFNMDVIRKRMLLSYGRFTP